MPRVTLIGFRGTGKTSVADRLARRLGCAWTDADVAFEQWADCSVAEFFARHGEPAFRDRETELLDELLGTCDGVLATGGGVVIRETNRGLLATRGRPVVWLDATVDAIRSRLAADPATVSRRPGLTGADPFAEAGRLLFERTPFYASVADLRIDTSALAPDTVADTIARWLEEWSGLAAGDGPP